MNRSVFALRTTPLLLVIACAKAATEPTETPEAPSADGPGVAENTYVSDDKDDEALAEQEFDDGFAKAYDCECVVTSPEAAHELADAAVADQLNRKQSWKQSPVMPSQWPTTDRRVRIYFYPLAQDPGRLSQAVMFSAAYAVDVSLQDGATEVSVIEKKKQLGTVEEKRPSMLERNELALAERALVHTVLGGDASTGENSFWGYKKFFREHPKMAQDLRAKSPDFYRWVENYKK